MDRVFGLIFTIVTVTSLVVAALVAVLRIRRSRLQRRKLRAFVPCQRCGFDLRATSGPCPSCGNKREADREDPPASPPKIAPPREQPSDVLKKESREPVKPAPSPPPSHEADD